MAKVGPEEAWLEEAEQPRDTDSQQKKNYKVNKFTND